MISRGGHTASHGATASAMLLTHSNCVESARRVLRGAPLAAEGAPDVDLPGRGPALPTEPVKTQFPRQGGESGSSGADPVGQGEQWPARTHPAEPDCPGTSSATRLGGSHDHHVSPVARTQAPAHSNCDARQLVPQRVQPLLSCVHIVGPAAAAAAHCERAPLRGRYHGRHTT
jgi:hypothetical protein